MYLIIITDGYDNIAFTNCTEFEIDRGIIITTLHLTKPSWLSFFFSLIVLLLFTLIKPLSTNK